MKIEKHGVEVFIDNFIYNKAWEYVGLGHPISREVADDLLDQVPKDIYGFAQLGEIDAHFVKRTDEFEYWLGFISINGNHKELTLVRMWSNTRPRR